jgi:hypothetical protein
VIFIAASEPNPLRNRPTPITVMLYPKVTKRLPTVQNPHETTKDYLRLKLSEKKEMIRKPKIAPR